jgi:hypothetical protein
VKRSTRTAFVFASSAFVAWIAAPLQARAASDWNVPSSERGATERMDEMGQRAIAHGPLAAAATLPPAPTLTPANWRALGPFGGDIADVQASPLNPSIVLAALAPASGSGGGVYRSTDTGATWTSVATLSGKLTHAIEFAPDGTAYAGTIDGVWKSTDGGATFLAQNLGIGLNDEVFDIQIDPANPQRLWIGVADALGNQPVNVMLTTNGGASWTNKTPPLAAPQTCYTVAINPTNANEVFAGFGGFGGGGQVWVSTNGGTSWTDRSAGLPARPVHALVYDGARVLVGGGQLFGTQNFGLYSTSNLGVTWNQVHDGTWPNLVTQSIAVDPNDVNTIYVATAGQGLFRSTNGGTTWSFGVGGTGSLSVNVVRFSPGSSSVIYSGASSNAVWKSSNAGASFAASSTGIGALDVFSVAANPLNANEIAIAFQGLNDGGVFTSVDAGVTWSLAALPGTRYSHVRFTPQGQLYAISSGPTSIAQEGLYQRNGLVWTLIGPNQGPLFESDLTGLRVSANDPNFIIAVGADFGVAGFEPTVWRTINGGAVWTKVYEGVLTNFPNQDVCCADPATDLVFVAPYVDNNGPQNGGVLRSTDGGVTWARVTVGLPALFQSYSVSSLAATPSTLFVSNAQSTTGNGLFKSIDGGASWAPTGYIGALREVQTDANDASIVYAAPLTGTIRVLASIDTGVTFSPYDTGLATAGFVRDLQRSSRTLYTANSNGSYADDVLQPMTSFCFGDGTGTACPCGNNSAPGSGSGCLNSFGQGGLLAATGTNSVATDSVVLTSSGLPNGTTALFFQGTTQTSGGLGQVFGDGLRCAGGAIIRIGTRVATGGVAVYPGVGNPSVSVKGLVPVTGGTFHYQAWYRNSAVFCTSSLFNLSNGVTIPWSP